MTTTPIEKTVTERERDWKWIKRLIVSQVLTVTIAGGAFFLALQADQNKIDRLQVARVVGRAVSCRVNRGGWYAAAGPGGSARVRAYLDTRTGSQYANCTQYAKDNPK